MALKSEYNFHQFFGNCKINTEENSENLKKISHKEKKLFA